MRTVMAMLHGPRDVRLAEVTLPAPADGEVVVRVEAALTCGTDLKTYIRGGHPRVMPALPAPFGHEFSGVVAAVGRGVRGWAEGDVVVPANSAPCFRCFYCRRARFTLCEDLLFLSGAYAGYVTVPARIVAHNLYHRPAGLAAATAALAEPLACAIHGIERSAIGLGDTVAVNGTGPLGLMLIALARRKGARVIACGSGGARLDAARRAGAHHVVDIRAVADQVAAVRALTEDGRGVDVAIEAVGQPEVWAHTVAMTRGGGLATLFGGCAAGTTMPLETMHMHYGELTLIGVFHHTPRYFALALDVLAEGAIDPAIFLTEELPLAQVGTAFDRLLAKQGIKFVLRPSPLL